MVRNICIYILFFLTNNNYLIINNNLVDEVEALRYYSNLQTQVLGSFPRFRACYTQDHTNWCNEVAVLLFRNFVVDEEFR